MPDNRIKGLRNRKDEMVYRDTRGFLESAREAYVGAFSRRGVALSAIGACAVGMVVLPSAAPVFAGAGVVLGLTRYFVRPPTHGMTEGVLQLGTARDNGEEIWLDEKEFRRHVLALGETGPGKTDALLSMATGAMDLSSGFLFIDGKGDEDLFAKVHELARRYGREDDILVLNFMTGVPGGKILTNTLNPFSSGSPDSLTTMLVSLLDDVGGDSAMWKGRATAMFTGVMRALCWLRDQHIVDLNVGTVRDYLNLKAVIDLADPSKYPDMPMHIRKSVRSYLTSLPGYDESRAYRQTQVTLDSHAYLELRFTVILGSLSEVYGHVFFTASADVDMYDIVTNRRIVVVMLPDLDKAHREITDLGKLVIASLQGMMSAAVGASIEGSWSSLARETDFKGRTPFTAIFDGFARYAVEGVARMAAQASRLGIGIVFGGEDMPSMKVVNDTATQAILGNTGTKVFMAGERKPPVREGGDPLDGTDRINPRDVRNQGSDEMIVLHGDDVLYVRKPERPVTPLSSPSPNRMVGFGREPRGELRIEGEKS